MKKRLLLMAFAMLGIVSASAYENGDYIYTSTQKFKATSADLVVNGNFSEGLTGWLAADGESTPSSQNWSVQEGLGPNGENVLQSDVSEAGQAVCGLWDGNKLEENATYILTLQVKAGTAFESQVAVPSSFSNYINAFVNTTGSLTPVASTDEAPVTFLGASTYISADEWTTLSFSFTYTAGQYLALRLDALAQNTQVANITLNKVEEVYDDRVMRRKIDFVTKLLTDENFNTAAAAEQRSNLADNIIPMILGALDANALDDISEAADYESGLDEAVVEYLDITSIDIKKNDFFQYAEDLTSFPKYNRGSISNGQQIGGFMFRGDNWLHASGALNLTKQIQGTYQVGPGSVAFYNKYLPAGKYYIAAEMRNATCSKNYVYAYNIEHAVKAFVGSDTLELGTIKGQDYQRFYAVLELKEGETFEAGFYWDGPLTGAAFNIQNFELRSFGDVAADAEHAQAWEAFKAQWDAAVGAREKLLGMIGDKDYPWEQDSLLRAKANWDVLYNAQVAKGWVTEDGKDAGVATTEELKDWTLYQGVVVPAEEEWVNFTHEDSVFYSASNYGQYGLVRGYQKAINYVVAANKPIPDFLAAIQAAEAVRDDDMNQGGDKATFQAVIDAAMAVYNDVHDNTTDAKREADEARMTEQTELLAAATEAFKNSVPKLEAFVDIDFSKPAVEDAESGGYYIEGISGRMTFGASLFSSDNTVDNQLFTQGVKGELEDILRIGNGTAYVAFGEENIPGDDDVIRVSFDCWMGGLTGKYFTVDLLDENNSRVAGFSHSAYGSGTPYNDFDNASNTGLYLGGYVTGTGKNGDASLCVDGYKSSIELILDYKARTLQGNIVNGTKGTRNGDLVSFANYGLKATQFTVGSNYNSAPGRRCWFDNLKIYKYKSSAEGPNEQVGINTIVENKKFNNTIYNLNGQKVMNPGKGLYIINGKKVVLK